MVTTSSNLYWAPLKPRIRIFELSDDLYADPIYEYNAFTDTANADNKPIGLGFETSTTNVGQCSLRIEDADQNFNENDYLKGNRIFIEGSKDGSSWQPAFRGLGRGVIQEAYGITGRNLVFIAYNYLIRLNERIVQLNKESSKTGTVYNDTDTTMFTDNLINNILTDDDNYVFSTSEAGGTGKPLSASNITSSPITQWIPKLDVEFNTLSSAIDEVLDYSGGLLTVNFADDQLVLYDPEQVTSATGVFMVTNRANPLADEVNQTMYPLEPYNYHVYYDTDESANRLILPFKSPDSAAAVPHQGEPTPGDVNATAAGTGLGLHANQRWAYKFMAPGSGSLGLIRVCMFTVGNVSFLASNSTRLWIHNEDAVNQRPGIAISGPTIVYPQAADGTYPTGGVGYPSTPQRLLLGMKDHDDMGELLSGKIYWLAVENSQSASLNTTNGLGWIQEVFQSGPANPSQANTNVSTNAGSTWQVSGTSGTPRTFFIAPNQQGSDEINLDWIVMANDRNGEARLGKVERTVTSIPNHIDGLQTIQEYLYPRLYLASKPRFSFDYPSLSMPNRIPKAGDVLCHYDTTMRVGTSSTPVQTSIITNARFEFGQDNDGVLGLRKLGLSTLGLRKGYY